MQAREHIEEPLVYCRQCGLSALECGGRHRKRSLPLRRAGEWIVTGFPGSRPNIDPPSDLDPPPDAIIVDADPPAAKAHQPSQHLPRRGAPLRALLAGIAILSVLAGLAYWYSIPAPQTVTIRISAPQMVTIRTETLALHPQDPNGAVRLLHATLSKTGEASASGQGHTPALPAHGSLNVTNQNTSWLTIPAGARYQGSSGVTAITDTQVQVPPANLQTTPPTLGEAVVPAHTLEGGAIANLPPHDIDLCCNGGVVIRNTSAFWGGKEGESYPILATSDLSTAAEAIEREGAQQGKKLLQGQLDGSEQIIEASIQCSSSRHYDQKEGAHVKSARIQLDIACTGLAYVIGKVKTLAWETWQQHSRPSSFRSASYRSTSLDRQILSASIENGISHFTVRVTGIWIREFTRTECLQLASELAGKSSQQAKRILQREGIVQASFSRTDQQFTLPDAAHIAILPVPTSSS